MLTDRSLTFGTGSPLALPTDAVIRTTSSGICGSDLHLYEVMGPFMN